MELRLQLLDTFTAPGSDGATYKVCAYDRLAPDISVAGGGADAPWISTGVVEYRLADGRPVQVSRGGQALIAGSDVQLDLPAAAAIHER